MKSLFFTAIIIVLTTLTLQAQEAKPLDPNEVNQLISVKQELDEKGTFKDRYAIQIYYGNRTKANEVKEEYDASSLEWKCELFWESPNLAVRVGKFRNRLEADRALFKVKPFFPNAMVMKP